MKSHGLDTRIMKKLMLNWPLLLVLLFLQAAAFAQQDAAGAIVRVAKASVQTLVPVTIVPGTVVSRNDANLAAEVTGRLLEVADVGTVVTTGGTVARIEDTQLLLKRDENRGEVSRAEARLKFLEKEESRFVTLAESNLAAATQLEETRSDRDVARGDLQVAKSRLAQTEDQLSRTRITAPFGGIVVERLMMPGERVDIGTDVVRLVDQQHLEVIARAPLEYFSYVQPGRELALVTGEDEETGIVRTVVAVGSENTHQFELRLDIAPNRFPVGQTLRVSIPTSTARQALAVPRDALVLRPEGISVFVVEGDNTARQVTVTPGISAAELIEIIGAVNDGEMVIIRGNERLRPGQKISILED